MAKWDTATQYRREIATASWYCDQLRKLDLLIQIKQHRLRIQVDNQFYVKVVRSAVSSHTNFEFLVWPTKIRHKKNLCTLSALSDVEVKETTWNTDSQPRVNLDDGGRYLSHCYLPDSLCPSSWHSFKQMVLLTKWGLLIYIRINGLAFELHQVEHTGCDRKGDLHSAGGLHWLILN